MSFFNIYSILFFLSPHFSVMRQKKTLQPSFLMTQGLNFDEFFGLNSLKIFAFLRKSELALKHSITLHSPLYTINGQRPRFFLNSLSYYFKPCKKESIIDLLSISYRILYKVTSSFSYETKAILAMSDKPA